MSAISRPTDLFSTKRSLSRSQQRDNVFTLSNEQLPYIKHALVRYGTHDSTDSAPTSNSSTLDAEIGKPTLDLRLNVHSLALSQRSPTETADEKANPISERAQRTWRQRFCLHWFTAYRILITSVLLTNLAVVISQLGIEPTVEVPLTATAANIMVAVLLRQEEVINTSFRLVAKIPSVLPLSFRRIIGDFHHYGGVHIGCALSALLWYCTFVGLNTIRVLGLLKLENMTGMLYVDIITAYTALLAIILICATAIPRFRVRFHNTFEATHRFGGWATLLVLWVHAGITTLTPDVQTPLYAHASIWILSIATFLIILPWLRIRRVAITASRISAREVQLTFPYKNMPYTSTIRTSTSPLTEWHAFATIRVNDHSAKVIIAQAGDWTKTIIELPPTKIWVRNPPTLNFLTLAPLFNSLLLVATGAGIGPMLSLLTSPSKATMLSQGRKVRVMWCAYDPHAAHWQFVIDVICKVDGAAKVLDSKTGRPDIAFEAQYLAVKEEVEAVMVVSNPKVTQEVVNECKMRGLAAYGAVFDS
jgi:hypothetical protein